VVARVVTAMVVLSVCIAAVGAAEARPDERIVFVVKRSGFGEIWMMSPAGSGGHRLTAPAPRGTDAAGAEQPSWSPDGRSTAGRRASISFGQTAAASNRLVASAGDAEWSPDGKRIALATIRDGFGRTCFHDCSPSAEIYVMRSDGTGLRRLTTSLADDTGPAWSPDGRRIAFVSDRSDRRGHQYEIYVIAAGGGPAQRITRNKVWDLSPDWR